MHSFRINNLEELDGMAQQILDLYPGKRIVALTGDLGAGKTASVKAFLKALGSKDDVSSPTFSLVNEYESERGVVYHFDLYRLEDPEEILAIGLEEYLESGAYCFIEWPEKIAELLPESMTIRVNFVLQQNQSRLVTIE